MTVEEDRQLAQKWCEELRNDERQAIEEVRQRYGARFEKFISFRCAGLTNDDRNDLLQSFWQGLSDGKAICSYEGRNSARLGSYLQKLLDNRIKSFFKARAREITIPVGGSEELATRADTTESFFHEPVPRPEIILSREEQQRLLKELTGEALLRLSEIDPEGAWILRQRSKGIRFKDIARANGYSEEEDGKEFQREDARLRQKAQRSEKKVKTLFNSLLLKRGLLLRFSDEGPIFYDHKPLQEQEELCLKMVWIALEKLNDEKSKSKYLAARRWISRRSSRAILARLALPAREARDNRPELNALRRCFLDVLEEKGYTMNINRGMFFIDANGQPT